MVSCPLDEDLELWVEGEGLEEEVIEGVEDEEVVLETPNWKGDSDIWILLGV